MTCKCAWLNLVLVDWAVHQKPVMGELTQLSLRSRILLNRLTTPLDQQLPESQCGFRKERRTINMVFAARQRQEKCQEQNADLFSTYVNLTEAFDIINRDGLWKSMDALRSSSPWWSISMMACKREPRTVWAIYGHQCSCVFAAFLFSLIDLCNVNKCFRKQM